MTKDSTQMRIFLTGVCVLSYALTLSAQREPVVKPHSLRGSVPVLMRRPNGAIDANLALLQQALFGKLTGQLVKDNDRLRALGEHWHVDVFGDGSAAEFVDQSIADRAHANGVEISKAMNPAALETKGRAYIEQRLAKIISLQPGERLVAVATSYRKEGGVASDGTHAYSAVVANRIIFGREINGIAVVGAGSKVTVTFLNDGSVESVRYDWPNYVRVNREQRIATSREIWQRIQQVSGLRTNEKMYKSFPAPQEIETIRPVKLGKNVEMQDLQCGYYDPGYQNRDPHAPIQFGCYYHVLHKQGKEPYITAAAYSGAVPGAASPEPDNRWPEAQILRGSHVRSAPPAGMASMKENPQPIPMKPTAEQIRQRN